VCITGGNCVAGDLAMNSKCYRKFDRDLTWYNASNQCLAHSGSLAVFSDMGRPSDNSQLTNWLSTNETDTPYWVGLTTTWWTTTDDGNNCIIVFYYYYYYYYFDFDFVPEGTFKAPTGSRNNSAIFLRRNIKSSVLCRGLPLCVFPLILHSSIAYL